MLRNSISDPETILCGSTEIVWSEGIVKSSLKIGCVVPD
jgi:hypothetical protein